MTNKSSVVTDSSSGLQVAEESKVVFKKLILNNLDINEFSNPELQKSLKSYQHHDNQLQGIQDEKDSLDKNSINLNNTLNEEKEFIANDNPNLTPEQIQAHFNANGEYVEVDANGFKFVNPDHPYNKALKAKKEAEKKQEELVQQEKDLTKQMTDIEERAVGEIDKIKNDLEGEYRKVFPDYDKLKDEFNFGSCTVTDKYGNKVEGVITVVPKDEINTERKNTLEKEFRGQQKVLEGKIRDGKATDSERHQFDVLDRAIKQIEDNREKYNKYTENKQTLTDEEFKKLPLEDQVNPNRDVRVREFNYKDETGVKKSFKMFINEDPLPDKDGHINKTTEFYEDGKLVKLGDLAKGNEQDRAKLNTYLKAVEESPPNNCPNIKKVYFRDEDVTIGKERGVDITINLEQEQQKPVDITINLEQEVKQNNNKQFDLTVLLDEKGISNLEKFTKSLEGKEKPTQTQDDSQLTSTKVEESNKYSDIIKGLDLSGLKEQDSKQQKTVEPQERKRSGGLSQW